jgi:hypothetical protein
VRAVAARPARPIDGVHPAMIWVGPVAADRGVLMAACGLLRGRIITLCPALQIGQQAGPTTSQCSTSAAQSTGCGRFNLFPIRSSNTLDE